MRSRDTSPQSQWGRYRDNVARHLIGISRDLQSRVLGSLTEAHGYDGLRPSLGPFLSLVWREGRPLTAIASQLAISKQACSQLANLAEDAGYLERRPDPADRRAKVVRLTPLGRALVGHAVEIILESESAYAELIGRSAYRRFRAALAALYQGLGVDALADPALPAGATRSIGVLPLIAERVQRELMEANLANGHGGLKMSHAQVLPFIGPEGGRIHEIARLHRVSRQAISATSQDLEALGYLRREPDPRDRRGVVLRLTASGTRLIGDSVHALDELEHSFGAILGEGRLEQLQRSARDLYQGLHLEEDVFEAVRRQLGRRDAGRLAALLDSRAPRTTT
jgi:DNA-binding MarR family transcriptional regulator